MLGTGSAELHRNGTGVHFNSHFHVKHDEGRAQWESASLPLGFPGPPGRNSGPYRSKALTGTLTGTETVDFFAD